MNNFRCPYIEPKSKITIGLFDFPLTEDRKNEGMGEERKKEKDRCNNYCYVLSIRLIIALDVLTL